MLNMNIDTEVYHLIHGSGRVEEKTNGHIVVCFKEKTIKFNRLDDTYLLFSSKDEMFEILSSHFELTFSKVARIYYHIKDGDGALNTYFRIIDFIVLKKHQCYYKLINDIINYLIEQNLLEINSSSDSERIYELVEHLLADNAYQQSVNIAFSWNSSELLLKSVDAYCEKHLNDSLKQKKIFIFIIRKLKEEYNNCSGVEDVRQGLNKILQKIDEPVLQMIRNSEPRIDEFILKAASNDRFKDMTLQNESLQKNDMEASTKLKNERLPYLQNITPVIPKIVSLEDLACKTLVKNEIVNDEKDNRSEIFNSVLVVALKEYDIIELVHFTNIRNIQSIVQNGIIPRSSHKCFNINAEYTDQDRLDNRLDCTSLSVSFPNYRMLYNKKKSNECFVILGLDTELLHKENNGLFFNFTNAASNVMKKNDGNCKTIESFHRMFQNEGLRKQLKLPDNYTTDPQAEILVEGIINQRYISRIYVENKDNMRFLQKELKDTRFEKNIFVHDIFFSPRFDYKYWMKESVQDGKTIVF